MADRNNPAEPVESAGLTAAADTAGLSALISRAQGPAAGRQVES
jgi:hypothetical protein